MGKINRFEDIQAWQKARELNKKIYDITRNSHISKDLLMRSLVMSHTASLYLYGMPEVSQLTTCGDRLNRVSSVFLDSPVKPGNDKNVVLLMNSLV